MYSEESPVMPSVSPGRPRSVGIPAAIRKSGRASGVDAARRWVATGGRLKTGRPAEAGIAQECARPTTAQHSEAPVRRCSYSACTVTLG